MDLPFEPAKHLVAFENGKMNLAPASPAVAFHEEVRITNGPDGKVPVLVGQNFYKPNDRFVDINGERMDKYVTGEFIDNTVYGCQDGYTDLRGRFDYTSVNTPERQAIQRFSVLILSDDRGTVIREAAPPQQSCCAPRDGRQQAPVVPSLQLLRAHCSCDHKHRVRRRPGDSKNSIRRRSPRP